MEFLWDEGNVSKNVAKHKVSNKETEQAVQNELLTWKFNCVTARSARYRSA